MIIKSIFGRLENLILWWLVECLLFYLVVLDWIVRYISLHVINSQVSYVFEYIHELIFDGWIKELYNLMGVILMANLHTFFFTFAMLMKICLYITLEIFWLIFFLDYFWAQHDFFSAKLGSFFLVLCRVFVVILIQLNQ